MLDNRELPNQALIERLPVHEPARKRDCICIQCRTNCPALRFVSTFLPINWVPLISTHFLWKKKQPLCVLWTLFLCATGRENLVKFLAGSHSLLLIRWVVWLPWSPLPVQHVYLAGRWFLLDCCQNQHAAHTYSPHKVHTLFICKSL